MSEETKQEASLEPAVSVVIPTRDRRRQIERCLTALSRQTHADFEVVIVDDGSTDGSIDFIEDFSANHPEMRVRCVKNTEHLGANRSRNRGIREARGSLIAFLDSDCVAEPDWLDELTRGFHDERVAATTGLVENPPPGNIFELTYRGTSRVHAHPYPTSLVGGNMCIRRDLLLRFPLDEDLKYGCDEEGIYLRLRALGLEQRFVPQAKVCHEHPFTGRAFFRQARLGGVAAAWLVYKYHLPPRLDLLPLSLGYLTLPLVFLSGRLGWISAAFGAAAIAAMTYNELFRKGKTVGETIRSFPILLAYYHVRLASYVIESVALRIRRHGIKRERL